MTTSSMVNGTRDCGCEDFQDNDHARECVVRTGRKSSSLGREPDPQGGGIALASEAQVNPV